MTSDFVITVAPAARFPGRRSSGWAVLFPIKLLLPLTARSIFQGNIIALQYLRFTVCSVIYVQGQPVEGSCTRLGIPAIQLVLVSIGLTNLWFSLRCNETLRTFAGCYRRRTRFSSSARIAGCRPVPPVSRLSVTFADSKSTTQSGYPLQYKLNAGL